MRISGFKNPSLIAYNCILVILVLSQLGSIMKFTRDLAAILPIVWSSKATASDFNSIDHWHLTHIVVPYIPAQQERLKETLQLFETYLPCSPTTANSHSAHPLLNVPKPVFTFYVSHTETESVAQREALQSEMLIAYANLSRAVRACFHATPLYKTIDIHSSVDGHANGARLMFERLFHRHNDTVDDDGDDLLKGVQYAFLMEPDVHPIRPHWLTRLVYETAWPQAPFWIKGSVLRGPSPWNHHIPAFLYHINGNALYNFGDGNFSHFYFHDVRTMVQRKHNGTSQNAYDTDVSEFLWDPANYGQVQHQLHLFQYTNVIQNMAQTDYSVAAVRIHHPHTFLVHGRHRWD